MSLNPFAETLRFECKRHLVSKLKPGEGAGEVLEMFSKFFREAMDGLDLSSELKIGARLKWFPPIYPDEVELMIAIGNINPDEAESVRERMRSLFDDVEEIDSTEADNEWDWFTYEDKLERRRQRSLGISDDWRESLEE